MTNKIIYPSIDTFIYDLKDGLGQSEKDIKDNYKQFCHKIYGDLNRQIFEEKYNQILKYRNNQVERIELLETQIRKLKLPLDGYYYPVQLGDTLALQFDYSGKLNADNEHNDEPQDIADKPFFKLIQDVAELTFEQSGTIGQTYLLWGQLTESRDSNEITNIAKDCYTQAINDYNWKRDLIGSGKWKEGNFFELWHSPENSQAYKQDYKTQFSNRNVHLLIWLFPYTISPDEMRERVRASYYDLMCLFQYRHKIIWSYNLSRGEKNILKREYVDVQPSVEQIASLSKKLQKGNLRLNQLQKTLTDNLINLSQYTIALNALKNHSNTITVNLNNYRIRLTKMNLSNNQYPENDLNFLDKFINSDIYAKKYQNQLNTECLNFDPGLTLLESLNSTIQGIVELQRAKSERSLDTTIAIIGIGLTVSGLVAAAISEQQPKSIKDISFIFSPVFVWSIVITVFTWLLFLIFRSFRR